MGKAGKAGKFTRQQRLFIESFTGSVKEAAKVAGLSYDYCRQLVTLPHIQEALKKKQDSDPKVKKAIASRRDRLAFWTSVMNDPKEDKKHRLKASELLGKANCDFSEKRILEGGDKPIQHAVKLDESSLRERIRNLLNGDEYFLK